MVHYIRFLRTPQCELSKKTADVSAVVAVQTDLGDALLSQDVLLDANLVEANSSKDLLHSQPLQWQATSRALKFTLPCPGKYISRSVRLQVTTKGTQSTSKQLEVPAIIDVWSSEFRLFDKVRSEPVIERQLRLSNGTTLRLLEDTGESIARHIWDASLGFLMFFARALFLSPPQEMSTIAKLVRSSKVRRLRVLELGAGCGVVGIAFAQLIKCDMLLTDLEDAQEILSTNSRHASPMAGSTIQTEVLDWASSLEGSSNSIFDLVLVSDCIYNPDSSLHLVEILRQLVARAPDTAILVGFKRRHEADTIFFDRMRETNFEIVGHIDIPLPHTATDYDSDIPTTEFYTYRQHTALRPQG
ncbi:hypothetical protein H2200_009076 [Cladophialophora chaetospira]|uniref:Uncharacterized protein n=1 Tax=Cladophialophora chaetospira TaxID=386627 RepID=A0AA39CFD2_9EURO|nr:hypothetical protein H2200_009076 [Cladophialophora chaetospira]